MTSFTIITAVKNAYPYIEDAIVSVNIQVYTNYEHLVLDSNSDDGTTEFLRSLNNRIKVITEKDSGIYDALNKGIHMASHDVIGILHADDFYVDSHVLSDVAKLFDTGADIVYADLDYVQKDSPKFTLRKWKSKLFHPNDLEQGWMPPHPTFFFKKQLVEQLGYYNLDYDIASDYDFMIRYIRNPNLSIKYLPRTIIKMRTGGQSNNSCYDIIRKSYQDYLIAQNHFRSPLGTVICKNLRKFHQIQFTNLWK